MNDFNDIISRYGYMDNMPPEGWFWEIIRRTNAYQKIYDNTIKSSNPTEYYMGTDLQKEIGMFKKIGYYPSSPPNSSGSQYFVCKLNAEKGYYILVPNPEVSYAEFDIKPAINARKFIIRDFEDIKMMMDLIVSASEVDPNIFKQLHMQAIYELSPGKAEDVIFVGISKYSTYSDLLNGLLPRLKELLITAPQRIRTDKWKYYLIVFDMRKTKMDYKEISDRLCQAFPDDASLLDERNIANHYKNALEIINGGYLKYLRPQ